MAADSTNPDAELNSATGQNDPGGIWGFLQSAEKAGVGAADVIQLFTGKKSAPAPAAAPAASSPDWMKYLPWAIGGVVLLVVVGMVFKK
jgi:hypothetical protein